MAAKSSKSPGLPTPAADASQGPEQDEPTGELADRMAKGPAGTQLGDEGEIKLPEGSKESTRREAEGAFTDRPIQGPTTTGTAIGGQLFPPISDAASSPEGYGSDWERRRAQASQQEFSKACDQIAEAIEKFTKAGLGGQAAGEIACRVWDMTRRG